MKITRCYLRGYRRIALTGIQQIDWQCRSTYQIILGTNGSGKSSLLQELSPLPAQANDFYPGGCKHIEITHRQNDYVLISYLEKTPQHLFYKNGEQLNDNGKITIQRQLVEQEFGITDTIHELMRGQTRLTSMTPTKRREIISLISDQDMDFAFSLYKRIATALRDQQGAIKHTRQRIAQETDKLQAYPDETLSQQVEQLQQELTLLMENRRRDQLSASDAEQIFQRRLDYIDQLSRQIIESRITLPEHIENAPDNIEQYWYQKQSELESKKKMYQQYIQDYQQIQQLVGSLEHESVEDIDTLRQRRNQYQQQIDAYRQQILFFTIQQNVETFHETETFRQQMQAVLQDLPDNSEQRFSQQQLQQQKQKYQQQKHHYDQVLSKYNRQKAHLDQLEAVDHTECPKCHHKFRIGVCDTEIQSCKGEVQGLEKAVTQAHKDCEKTSQEIEAIEEYLRQYKRLRELAYWYPPARDLFEYLSSERRIDYQPSQYMPMVDRFIHDVCCTREIQILESCIQQIDQTIKQLDGLQDQSKTHMNQSMQQLQQTIDSLSDDIRSMKDECEYLQKIHRQVQEQQQRAQQLIDAYHQLQSDYQCLIESTRQDQITELIQQHQSTLASKQQWLKEQQSLEKVIEDLQTSIDQLEQQYQVYKVLTHALSPQQGIIGDQMLAFITSLVEQINEVIAGIYAYPLQLLPCQISSQELDYRFPLLSGEDHLQVSDIQYASEGQREIIDFAFQLIALVYLDCQDYPLYLDEIGQNQDETHFAALMDYIKMVIDSGRHNQLFMVSHQAIGHGAFQHSDVLVLNANNITIPARYNEHVAMT